MICDTLYVLTNNSHPILGFETKIRLKRPPFEIIMRYSLANATQSKKNTGYRNWVTRAIQMNPSHNN